MSRLNTVLCQTLSRLVIKNAINLPKMFFYAVAKGRAPGIYLTWPDCEAQVKGFSGAKFKKFGTVEAAHEYVKSGKSDNSVPPKQTFSLPSSSKSNLKRTYSKSSSNEKNKKPASKKDDDDSDPFSDGSDDLNTILTKQLDDVEKRLKGVGKNVDKIIKQNTKNVSRQAILIDPPQAKRRRSSGGFEFNVDKDGFVEVYTDGACSANGSSGAKAGLGVYWGEGHRLNVSEPVSGRATNNCGEIQAATRAIKIALQNDVKKLCINTDSQFLINSVTKWIPGWKRKGWKLASGGPVKNETDFKDLDSVQNQLEVKWNYVEAHRGVHGNEMADQLAKAGAMLYTNKE